MAAVYEAWTWLLLICTGMLAASIHAEAPLTATGFHSSTRPPSSTTAGITLIKFYQDFQEETCTKAFGPAPLSGSVGEFGQGRVFDYPVLDRDESGVFQEIGRARGIHIYESLDADGVQEVLTISFSRGDFAGSTLTIVGHGVQKAVLHELAVTGGTGVFKFARGSAVYQQLHSTSSIDSVEVTLKDVLLPTLMSD